MRSPRSGWLARPIPGKSIVRTSMPLRPAAYPTTDCRYSNESRSTTRRGSIDSRYDARIPGRPRSCHHRFILPNGEVGSAIERAYAGTVSREATNPRRAEAMTISTFGARCVHASSGVLMYMLPWNRRYAGRNPPERTDPAGLLRRTSSRRPSSFSRMLAGRAAAIASTSGVSDDPPFAFRVLSGINTTISGFAIEVENAVSGISPCDRREPNVCPLRILACGRGALGASAAGFRRQPPSDDVLMAPRVRGRRHFPGILPRQFRIPWRHPDLVLVRRRPIDEETDVVVNFSGDHFRRIEIDLGPGLGIPQALNPEGSRPDPAGGVARILAEPQMARGHGPTPSMSPAAVRIQPGKGLPLRIVRVLAQEQLIATGHEQVCANAHAARRELLESRRWGVLHETKERTRAGHAMVRARSGQEHSEPERGPRKSSDWSHAEDGPKKLNLRPECAIPYDAARTSETQVQASLPRGG